MNSKWRWLLSIVLITIIPLTSLLVSNVSARTKRSGRARQTLDLASAQLRAPIYTAGNFSFGSTQQLLPGSLSATLGFQDVEPEIKIDIYGNIYIGAIEGVPAGVDLWKSTDKGANFVYLGQPDGAQCPVPGTCTNDAGLGGGDDSIDVSPGGYLYVSSLWLGSITMSASYDGGVGGVEPGQKWEVNPVAAAVPSDDRQWVAAYGPQTVYMSYRQILAAGANLSNVIFVAKSTDGGKTFPQQVATFPATSLVTARREGNLVVDPYNGNLYTSFRPQELNGHKRSELWLLKSTDGGSNWSMSQIYQGPAGTDIGNVFPVMAVDRGGNVHVAFSQCDFDALTQNSSNCGVYLMSSSDQGANWLAPVKVNNGAATSYAIFPWIVAGSPGVVDITWYGANITASTEAADWHLYFSQVTNALSNSPTFSQVQAVPQIIHNKDICLKGGACGTGNRKLAEYYQITLDPDGNANIAFTDTVNNNATGDGRTWFTKQTTGPSALIPPPASAPATFGSNYSLGSPGGEPGIKVDSHNCIFVTAPGGPLFRNSVNNGASFLPNVDPTAAFPLCCGDEDVLPVPQPNGARPDTLYFADLAQLTAINIAESTDGGATWFKPGPGGAAGEVDASTDRQWIAYDRGVPTANDLTVYEMDHEAASEEIRFNALTNDGVWSPPASGMTDPELILPPSTTFPNTNPGPVFADPVTHKVYGFFAGSTLRTNRANPPFGKMPNVWEALGLPPSAAGQPPGPFVSTPACPECGNHPVFKGVHDSPAILPAPAPTPDPAAKTYGSNAANDFPSAASDAGGNLYVVWAMNNARTNEYMVWLATSHDHGQSFYGPFQVSQGPGAAVMPWIAAGDAGRVNIVYYATTTAVDPNIAPATVDWNVMFAQSLNANTREPAFTISPVSHHVNHKGTICNQGLLCGSGTRTLADYFQVAIGPDGLANISYADNGPVPLPAGNPDTSENGLHTEYARQTGGPLGLTNPIAVTCLASSSIQPVSAVSRKTHGPAGDFDVDLPVVGSAGIECRTGGTNGDHKVIISFANTVQVGSASVASKDGLAMVSKLTVNGPLVTVELTKVTNEQTITISLNGVTDGTNTGNVSLPMGVLAGDTTDNRQVNSSDVAQTQTQSGQEVTSTNFREDVTVNGQINSSDISFVQARSGTGLP
jgi:hypothetical protein